MNETIDILLIEDNPADVELIREMMSDMEKYTFTTADRLSSGLKILRNEAFDVVLLDLGLPDSNGIDTFSKIQDQAPDLPVIVLTVLTDENLAVHAISLGGQDYLIKGQIDGKLLVRSIRYAIERKRAEEALRESEARLHEIASTAFDAVILIDNDGNVSFWNDAARRMFGYTNEEITGKYLHSFIMPERHIDSFKKGFEAFRTTGEGPLVGRVYEIEAKRKDGVEFPVELSLASLKLKDKWSAVGIARDITDRKRGERELAKMTHQNELILESAGDGIFGMDSRGTHILANSAGARMLGYAPGELIGKPSHPVWHHTRADGSPFPEDECSIHKTARDGISRQVRDEVFWRKDGTAIPVEYTTTPIYEGTAIVGAVLMFRDITERKRMEEEIRHLAHHDALTGLPNRRLFKDLIELEIQQAIRDRRKLAVLFLDLDRFKEINDTLGHEVGDELLKQAAVRFRQGIRKSDTVARIGGDEFNIILADIGRLEDISDVAQKIIDRSRSPFIISGQELNVTTSMGISVFPDDSGDIDSLLRYADIAMYHAKESGKNTYKFYNPAINVLSLERMRLEGYLRQAIKRGELSVLYQPQIDINSKKVRYAEALVRWNHPGRGLLEPKDFMPLAEETGFITSIDEWVLRTACTQAGVWKESGLDSVCVTVNLSARQFQSMELVNMISTILKETGMTPHCLDLEVTESTAMSNVEQSASQLRELQEIGVHISIDDFGTGYSSLNYLKKLPIERLKIDKSFIRDIVTDQDDRAIIGAVTSMARRMGIRTVAEGVETEEQLAFLRSTECDEVQGFLFSRPVPDEEFRKLLGQSA